MIASELTNQETINFTKVKSLCDIYANTFMNNNLTSDENFVQEFIDLLFNKFNYRQGIDQDQMLDFDGFINMYTTRFALDLKERRRINNQNHI